ncbi:MAG: TolB family protein [Chloracidobacterium sp.]|nr:TolB family protein [Chloracidobacterium sp.]
MKACATIFITTLSCATLLQMGVSSSQGAGIGLFEKNGDIGAVKLPGSVEYDDGKKVYTIAGGGENMWAATDAFHYVWKRVSGDLSIAADIQFIKSGEVAGNPHRKACLIIRQSLDPDSPYADAALHGEGLTSLQYRDVKGGPTREIQSNVKGPRRIQIEKRGDYVFMSVAPEGEALQSAGGSFRIKLTEPFYVGLGVCAHDNNVIEKAVFSNVEIKQPILESTLETIAISSRDRRVVYTKRAHFEAPNWSRDGKWFLFNQGGRMYKLPVAGGEPQPLDTGFATRCNNDHGLSPDGTLLAVSDQSQERRRSMIYVLPVAGGTPRRVTRLGPSYWHGWSPDGKTLAYCAERDGDFDIYTVPAGGGEEKRLTTAKGLDDGPDYSHDGQYIYFNSERTGLMQIWRMRADGAEQTQITSDNYNNWFAHPSPDGKWIVFLSYEKDVTGHPANKDVTLRLMPVGGGEIQVLAKLFGGQGTINVPSWSPDSLRLAFVSYRLIDL